MLGPLAHVGSGLAYLATARRQQTSDLLTARQLATPPTLPRGLELTWLGTAGVRLVYEGTTLLIDPYVTRFSMLQLARRQVVATSADAVARWTPAADAILVGHTHFDHALDVPAIARRTGARTFGSQSLAHLMRLHGLGERCVVAASYKPYEVGPFRFHFVPSVHSRLQLGLAIPYSGEITCEHVDRLSPQAYRCGQVWGIHIEVAGMRLYHQGSADLIEDAISDRDVDVFLCGISGRRFTPRYIERIMRRLAPRAIIPTHYDNFFRPLDGSLEMSFNVNLTGFADEVRAVSRDIPLHVLEIGVPCRTTG